MDWLLTVVGMMVGVGMRRGSPINSRGEVKKRRGRKKEVGFLERKRERERSVVGG
jgi:hypothetical protein